MLSDIKVIAKLCIDTKTMTEGQIHDNWVVNQVPYALSVRKILAQIFGVEVHQVELRIRGETIYGPNPAILEVDCKRLAYDNFHNRIVESVILSCIWMGLSGVDIDPLDIRVDLEYISQAQPSNSRVFQQGVVSLP